MFLEFFLAPNIFTKIQNSSASLPSLKLPLFNPLFDPALYANPAGIQQPTKTYNTDATDINNYIVIRHEHPVYIYLHSSHKVYKFILTPNKVF